MEMADAERSLDYWRKFFSSAKSDIFELIEKAILVAAADCPNEFKDRKDLIAEKLQVLNNGDNEYPKEESQIVGEVMRIKTVLSNSLSESDSALYESLRSLELMQIPVETLMETGLGRTVNGLRKHSSIHIRELVRTLIHGWKALVDDWVTTDKITDSHRTDSVKKLIQLSETDSNSLLNKSKQPEKVSGSGMSKMEITKRKLHEGYQRAENAKKKRIIQIIELPDIPMDSHEIGRRIIKKPVNNNGR